MVSKSGAQISDKSQVEIKAEVPKYVCRWLLSSNSSSLYLYFIDIPFGFILCGHCNSSVAICTHRAGHKLEAAIEQLEIDVTGKVALDSGLSTGGFTDCLLQYGAAFVYGVDVGYGQVGF